MALTGGFSLARDISAGNKRITEGNILLKPKEIEHPKVFDSCCKDAKTNSNASLRAASPAARGMTELPALAALKTFCLA